MAGQGVGARVSPLRYLYVAPLIIAVVFLAAASSEAPSNVHPSVYDWAAEHPGQPVPIVVQSSSETDEVDSAVALAGGTVRRSFEIVPAVQAEIPASGLVELAEVRSVHWISLDAPVVSTGFVDVSALASAYPWAVNAPSVWNATQPVTGQGVGIAIIDTGITSSGNPDFADATGRDRVVAETTITSLSFNGNDGYGHGTHVAGIVAGDGDMLAGRYIGIAPGARLVDVKIASDAGASTVADAIAGIEWAVKNKDAFNIRVLNLSLHSAVAQSYQTDPLDAAVEAAWFSGLVVVVSAGNLGSSADAVYYPPANDPFVIVVGASDDNGTPNRADDSLAFFSSRGVTQDGLPKPDVVAPGRRIVSDVDANSVLARTYPARFVDGSYFRLSGTSMAAPVVSGIVALMLERNPSLTPGQVKWILTNTGVSLSGDSGSKHVLADGATFFSGTPGNADNNFSPAKRYRKMLVARLALIAHVMAAPDPAAEAARVGLDISQLNGSNLDTIDWQSIKWSSIKWDLIKWDLIKWDAIKWGSIKWDFIKWDSIKWDAIKWGSVKWDAITWSAITWSAIRWDSIKWDAIGSSDVQGSAVTFDSTQFDSVTYDSVSWDSFAGE